MKILIVFVTIWFASAASAHECGKSTAGGIEFGWCIDRDPSAAGDDVLYYMHGGGGDENTYFESAWASEGLKLPTVISFSLGTTLIGDVKTAEHPALLPIVLNEIMPFLEAKIGGVKGERLIMGHSLGGYNSAELALRTDLFAKAALLCPGLAIINPFSSDEEIEAFIAAQPSSTIPDYVRGIAHWVRSDFVTAEAWARHDPLALALTTKTKTKFYISCTKDDEYGFYVGAEKVAALLAKKTPTKFVSIEAGGHCAQSLESRASLIDFMNQAN